MNVLVLASGGIDSTACIAFYKDLNANVSALFVNYGQAAAEQERIAVRGACESLGVSLQEVAIESHVRFGGGAILGRNAMLYMVALQFGQPSAHQVSAGIHAGTPYIDCSQSFLDKINAIYDLYSNGAIVAVAPFIDWDKRKIWEASKSLKSPIELTYSCELGFEQPCKMCDSCKDLEALYALS